MSRAGSLCRDLGTLGERNKNQLCYYMTTEPAHLASHYCDAGIPAGNFPSNHACLAVWQMNQARNKTAGVHTTHAPGLQSL